MSSVGPSTSMPGARGPDLRAASNLSVFRMASAIGRESLPISAASAGVKSPLASVRWKITPPHARPRLTMAVRISCGSPNGARKSLYRALRSGRPRVVSLRIADGSRRLARDANMLTSSRWYSLASTAPAPTISFSAVMKPLANSSTGLAVVIRTLSGSSPCQHAASIVMTVRMRAVISLWRSG